MIAESPSGRGAIGIASDVIETAASIKAAEAIASTFDIT
jgi:hypothetical protein